ncbi:hypothetical protein D3C86_1854160 [compost metagenome]
MRYSVARLRPPLPALTVMSQPASFMLARWFCTDRTDCRAFFASVSTYGKMCVPSS